MAHNINYSELTEQYSFFSVKEKAWHNLGQVIQDYPTSAEAIHHSGLDYEVQKRKLFTSSIQNSTIEVPNYFSTVRSDNDAILGVVGKDYQIVQNRDAFSFFDAIVQKAEKPKKFRFFRLVLPRHLYFSQR